MCMLFLSRHYVHIGNIIISSDIGDTATFRKALFLQDSAVPCSNDDAFLAPIMTTALEYAQALKKCCNVLLMFCTCSFRHSS